MPNDHKLPTLDGTERELREGDRVRLRCGIDETIKRDHQQDIWRWDGLGGFCWAPDGRYDLAKDSEFDIVLILGPEREEHGRGDGLMVTQIKPLPVTGLPDDVDRVIGVDLGYPGIQTSSDWSIMACLQLRPATPPAPHPWLIELAKRIETEKTGLPVSGTALVHLGTEWFWRLGDKGAWPHATELFGPLPPRDDDTPNEVTVEEIRAAREWVKQQEGNDGRA